MDAETAPVLNDPARVTLAILAGGEGSRMGRPKGLLEVNGRPILRHLLDRLDWPGPTLLVTAPGREHPPGWEAFDREAVDAVAGEGPLRGVLTALEHARTHVVVVVVVDMPLVMRRQVEWLLDELARAPEAPAVMSRRGEAIEPFPSAFRRDLAAPLVAGQLAAGHRAVHGLSRSFPQVRLLEPPPIWPPEVWTNLNQPSDLAMIAGHQEQ